MFIFLSRKLKHRDIFGPPRVREYAPKEVCKYFLFFVFQPSRYGNSASSAFGPSSSRFCEESVSAPRLFLSCLLRLLLPRRYPYGIFQCWGSGSACFWSFRIRSFSLRYGSGSGLRIRILPFSHKGVKCLQMLAK
jgi:hypothetical protein